MLLTNLTQGYYLVEPGYDLMPGGSVTISDQVWFSNSRIRDRVNGILRGGVATADAPPAGYEFDSGGVLVPTGAHQADVAMRSDLIHVNVKTHFGAVGDGVTNDTAAVNAALSSVLTPTSVKHVYFPPGTYACDNLTLQSNVLIEGALGAKLLRRSGVTGALATAASSLSTIEIHGLEFDNNSSADKILSFPNGSSDITIEECLFDTYTSAMAIEFTGGAAGVNRRCRVEHNSFVGDTTGSNISCILAVNPNMLRISWNRFNGSGAVSIATSSFATERGYDIRVEGNDFSDIDASGILVRPNGDTEIQRVRVINNTGQSMGKTLGKGLVVVGEHVGTGTGHTYDVVIAGNTLRDFGSDSGGNGGNFITCGGVGGLVENATIANNICDARLVDGTLRTNLLCSGISIRTTTGVTVTGNRTRYTGRGGIRLNGVKDFTVVGNSIDHATQATGYAGVANEHGISMFVDTGVVCSQGVIASNTVRNTGIAADGCCGIGSDRNVHDHITVAGNRAYDDRTPKLQAYGIQLGSNGSEAEQPTNWTITDNDISDNLTGDLHIAATTAKGHRISLNPSTGVRDAVLMTARGIITETVPVGTLQNSTGIDVTAATAVAKGYLVGFRAGEIVTGIAFLNATPTSLTGLTKTRVAITSKLGVVLAVSADQSSDTGAGLKSWTMTTPWTAPVDDGYYLLFFSTGTSGSWNVWRSLASTGGGPSASINSGKRPSVKSGVVSDLTVNDALTLVADGNAFWFAAY